MTDGEVIVEDGGIADIDEVMSVMNRSFDPCYGEAWTAPQCVGLLPMPGVWLTIARLDGRAVGFAMARVVAREAELLLLAVKAEDQRRGVGQRLLDAFVTRAVSRGAQRLHLEVREGNHAVKLYGRSGFTQVGRRRNYYSGRDGQIYDALTLALDVAN
ncbi:MAG TPA: ribosomal protein S18-alanine N-acetyltransferase [Allosphingosinicella sp.]|jgi:ribosomal-protein-alanine N-acetyltransferase